jgi:peptidoglycan lytic transglycosylase
MAVRNTLFGMALAGALALAPKLADAQSIGCEHPIQLDDSVMACYRYGPELPPPPAPAPPEPQPSPFQLRALKYAALSLKHKLAGLASYYSASLDGTLTATGAIFHNRNLTAAHLTLPLGTWVEVTSRATGKTIRVLVNDRGPYAKKFTIDLSKAAARALGVDVAEDRYVDIRVVALPGEEPLPENWQLKAESAASSIASAITPEE